jgi:hypothetical protein
MLIVNNVFLKANEYYAIVIEYNTTYNFGVNRSQLIWGRSSDKLIKMSNTSIPIAQIQTYITSNSVVTSLMWPIEIPYFKLEMNATLNDINTSLPIETISSETYLISKHHLQNLSAATNYRLSTIIKRQYLPNILWTVSEGEEGTIKTLSKTSTAIFSRSSSPKLIYQQIVLFSLFEMLFFNLF